jgi:hypothetical protein
MTLANRNDFSLVYLIEEHLPGVVLVWGAHASMIRYTTREGVELDTWIDNDEFVVVHESIIPIVDDEEWNRRMEEEK